MLNRYLVTVLILTVFVLAGCGGSEEPTPTPTPLATFTPTAAPTVAPTEAPTEVPTEAPTEAATPVPAETATVDATAMITDAGTPAAGDVFAPSVIAPESPLAAPESPLAAPPEPAAAPTQAPISGAWQLQTVRASDTVSETAAPTGYLLAFSPTGVVRVTADCKTGRGSITRTPEGTLAFDVAFVDMLCAPDSLADPFERALSEVTGYRFEGDRLVLNYGTQGGEMGLARASQMAAFGAPFLSWSNLKNSTFLVPGTPAGDGQAPLVDGEFRTAAKPAAEAAVTDTLTGTVTDTVTGTVSAPSDFVVSLATMHTYGELDPATPEPTPAVPPPADATPTPTPEPEIAIDSVLVLVVNDNSATPKSYLAPVLNGGGLAIPLTLELLGENVYVRDLRWDGSQLTVDFDQGTEGKRRVYTFETDHFVQASEEGLPAQPPKGRLDLPAQDVALAAAAEAGGTPASTLTGAIEAGVVHPYRILAQAGQQLTVTMQSPFDDVWLSLYGTDDHAVLRSIRSETSSWAGAVPTTQDYIVSAVASGSASPYTLTIELAGNPAGQAPVQTQVQTPTAAGNVVHLAIDGVPQAALLDVLQRNNAQADFFVTVEQAAQGGSELPNAAAGGNGVGIIAGPVAALTAEGRDTLFTDISAARQDLGESGAKCLRPPYAATDGYTRAAASELGFDVLLWDIDAGSTAADALVGQVFPGAVIHFADSGDGGQATAAALETLLPLLTQQGYSVQAACR